MLLIVPLGVGVSISANVSVGGGASVVVIASNIVRIIVSIRGVDSVSIGISV